MSETTADETWVRVCALQDLRVDDVKAVEVNGVRVGVYRLADGCFALHDVCTHAFAHMSDGFVEDGVVECPLHQARFEIRTGKTLDDIAPADLTAYAVKVEGDDVFVRT